MKVDIVSSIYLDNILKCVYIFDFPVTGASYCRYINIAIPFTVAADKALSWRYSHIATFLYIFHLADTRATLPAPRTLFEYE